MQMRNKYIIAVWIIVCALLVVPLSVTAKGHNKSEKVFSNPEYVSDMGEDWEDKPIRYKEEAGDLDLAVVVNQQVSPALLPFVKKFAEDRDLKIDFKIGTCGISSGALSRKEVDMGGYCCPPGKIDRLPGLKFHTLGITPLLLLVHKDNPVRNVSLSQARKLFSGEITNWQQVGGPDLSVRPLGMLHCKKRPGHWRMILDKADMYSPEFRVTGNIEDTLSMVARIKGSIGFEIMINVSSFGLADKVRALKIDGYDPLDLKRMRLGLYPFYRTMSVTTWEGREVENQLSNELADFMIKQTRMLSPEEGIVSADELRKEGWVFKGNELVGDIKR